MKKIIAAFMLVMTIFSSTAFATETVVAPAPVTTPAKKDIDVIVNGEKLVLDVAPIMIESRTMVPMRAIFEALGAKVEWLHESRIIIATKDELMITMQIDNNNMVIERAGSTEREVITLDVAPIIRNNRTLVPARAVSEALEAKVDWDGNTRTVTVVQNEDVNSAGTN